MGNFPVHLGYLTSCPNCSQPGSVEYRNSRKGTYFRVKHYATKAHRQVIGRCNLRYEYIWKPW